MRLGTQTGNLMTHLMTASKQAVPTVGMGVAVCYWSDRKAGTIVEIDDKKSIVTIRQDKATRIGDGPMNDCQSYTYEADEQGSVYKFKFKDGKWRQLNLKEEWNPECTTYVLSKKGQGCGLIIGHRDEYYDLSF